MNGAAKHMPLTTPEAIWKSVRAICLTLVALTLMQIGFELIKVEIVIEAQKQPAAEVIPATPELRENKL